PLGRPHPGRAPGLLAHRYPRAGGGRRGAPEGVGGCRLRGRSPRNAGHRRRRLRPVTSHGRIRLARLDPARRWGVAAAGRGDVARGRRRARAPARGHRRTRVRDRRMMGTDLGLGTAQLGDLFEPLDQHTATAIVDAAWACGIRLFDTAPHYGLGLAEERLGTALRHRRREQYRLSTKVGRLIVDIDGGRTRTWDFSADGVRTSLMSSLRRLGLDSVDTALVHDPEGHLDEALTAAYPELERMRSAGIVDAIGVGSRHLPSLVRFVRETDVDVVMVAG